MYIIMKYLSRLILILLVGLIPANSAFAGWAATVTTADSKIINIEGVMYQDNRVLAPVRSLAEALHAHVDWSSATGTVIITKGDNTIKLVNGRKEAIKNNEHINLDVSVQMVNDRLMVPLRFVSEALNALVQYSLLDDTVTIISAPPEKPIREYNSTFPANVALTNNGNL